MSRSPAPRHHTQHHDSSHHPQVFYRAILEGFHRTRLSFTTVVFSTSVWTAILGVGATVALVCGQNHYLRRPILTIHGFFLALLGGLLAGTVSGAAAEVFFQAAIAALLSPASTPGSVQFIGECCRLVAWSIFGGLLGLGVSFFVPNLKPLRGLMGGAIGGAVGSLGFMAAGAFLSEAAGRFVGTMILGFCIGMMIAIAEAVFRKAWLEISYGPKEIVTVNLGDQPVAIGSDTSRCAVFARGVPGVAVRYHFKNGQIECQDVVREQFQVVHPGDERTVGNIKIKVCVPGKRGQ